MSLPIQPTDNSTNPKSVQSGPIPPLPLEMLARIFFCLTDVRDLYSCSWVSWHWRTGAIAVIQSHYNRLFELAHNLKGMPFTRLFEIPPLNPIAAAAAYKDQLINNYIYDPTTNYFFIYDISTQLLSRNKLIAAKLFVDSLYDAELANPHQMHALKNLACALSNHNQHDMAIKTFKMIQNHQSTIIAETALTEAYIFILHNLIQANELKKALEFISLAKVYTTHESPRLKNLAVALWNQKQSEEAIGTLNHFQKDDLALFQKYQAIEAMFNNSNDVDTLALLIGHCPNVWQQALVKPKIKSLLSAAKYDLAERISTFLTDEDAKTFIHLMIALARNKNDGNQSLENNIIFRSVEPLDF